MHRGFICKERVFDGGDLDKAAVGIIGSNGSSNEKEQACHVRGLSCCCT